MAELPRITFGVIVLNGEPFTRYCLRQVYPFAHQIVVVEGACATATSIATEDGHSLDDTLESLRAFKEEEDPEDKLEIVTRDGFWTEKDEMSAAYAERATGDYLWQVDIDEFYRNEDLEKVCALLSAHPDVTAVSFRQLTFWGRPDVLCDSVALRGRGDSEYHRLFKWGDGYRYSTHRPPTVIDTSGRDTRDVVWLGAKATERLGIRLYHYSLLFPKQVREKCAYYNGVDWVDARGIVQWAEECYMRLGDPFRVHNIRHFRSWLERYDGPRPEQIDRMFQDIEDGRLDVDLRDMADADAVLRSIRYRIVARWLRVNSGYVYPWLAPLVARLRRVGFRRHFRLR